MNKPFLSGLTALLAGCPKTQNAVEPQVDAPHTSSFSLSVDPQLVAAYIIKNSELEEGVYLTKVLLLTGLSETEQEKEGVPVHQATFMYKPEGVQGSYADDQLILHLPTKPDAILCYDTGLDNKLDLVTDTSETTPWVPFSSLDAEQQDFLNLYYTYSVSAFADNIRKTEDIKLLQEVQPQ